ncbi:MAG: DUF4160 domain-containing protein [Defluviitaleaceae bacterium]|nr:DUF4160 domain-containing protein [Defluviitaleaceae bacterium]MCL2239712.1 DUF4160 domain-containing protein [Defluviitaleaceae bacterium]
MPQVFKVGPYVIYFWANEGKPLEPVHVHVSQGVPSENATKIWITKRKRCLLCHNRSKIPPKILKNIMEIIEARSQDIVAKWQNFFSETDYYC